MYQKLHFEYVFLNFHFFIILLSFILQTDPEGVDYLPEHGSTRLFEALRTAEKMAEAEEKRRLEEEADNPMKQLEKRTTASQREIEALEALEELKELNARYATLDHEKLIGDSKGDEKEKINAKMLELLQEEEDERIVKEAFSKKREHLSSDSDDDVAAGDKVERNKTVQSWKRVKNSTTELSNGKNNQTQKARLKGLIVQRPSPTAATTTSTTTSTAVNGATTCRQTKKPSNGLLNLQYGSSSDEDSN